MRELPNLGKYRPNVGICVLNKHGEVWLGKRTVAPHLEHKTPHRWQMPQGGMDRGESPEETAFRELYEETGMKSVRLLMMTPGWLVYDFPAGYKRKKGKNWRGQRQRWAVMLFEGEESEIDLDAHEEREFSEWRWVSIDEISDLVVPFKRGVYQSLVESFRPLAVYIARQYAA